MPHVPQSPCCIHRIEKTGGLLDVLDPSSATYVPLETSSSFIFGHHVRTGWRLASGGEVCGTTRKVAEVGRTLRGCGGPAVAFLSGRHPCTGDDSTGRRWAVMCGEAWWAGCRCHYFHRSRATISCCLSLDVFFFRKQLDSFTTICLRSVREGSQLETAMPSVPSSWSGLFTWKRGTGLDQSGLNACGTRRAISRGPAKKKSTCWRRSWTEIRGFRKES
ncbi:hypothetical protein B0T18DRAFT_84218 [Schizothecium vesticola]|uniref:Uncharacterized protein n=1 Tax=Schizothecium vesticola TaxID=314040 RepID=A0AA40KAJ9_9PEZI|nr:hypothetical protein B0T18DRAFT_84218 [Schizothecium vesticola]